MKKKFDCVSMTREIRDGFFKSLKGKSNKAFLNALVKKKKSNVKAK